LGERDRHAQREVPTLAPEQLVRVHVAHNIEVARRTAVETGATASGDADAPAIVDPRGDPHLDGAGPTLHTCAMAGGTRGLDPHARPATNPARRGEAEEALVVIDDA